MASMLPWVFSINNRMEVSYFPAAPDNQSKMFGKAKEEDIFGS